MGRGISVIVPVYYGEKYVAGIIRQMEECKKHLKDADQVELIFVNDAPDAPLSYAWNSEAVHVIVMNTDKNVGIHGTRVKGLKKCSGEYVLFLDQDDIVDSLYLYSQLHAIGENDAVVCDGIQAGQPLYSEHPVFENVLSGKLMLAGWNPIVSPGQVLLKRKSIPDSWTQNILTHNGADDWLLWICMMSENCTFTLNYEALYERVLTGENTSGDVVSMLQSEQEVMKIVLEKKLLSEDEFKLLLDGFFEMSVKRTVEVDTYKEKLNLIGKWIAKKENGESYSKYLSGLGIKRVAIYGCGILGDYLYDELKNDFQISYFIDKNAKNIQKKIPVWSLQDELPAADGVVISLIREVDEVKKALREKNFTNIVGLKELLCDKRSSY